VFALLVGNFPRKVNSQNPALPKVNVVRMTGQTGSFIGSSVGLVTTNALAATVKLLVKSRLHKTNPQWNPDGRVAEGSFQMQN